MTAYSEVIKFVKSRLPLVLSCSIFSIEQSEFVLLEDNCA
jgi:hypothetical protein